MFIARTRSSDEGDATVFDKVHEPSLLDAPCAQQVQSRAAVLACYHTRVSNKVNQMVHSILESCSTDSDQSDTRIWSKQPCTRRKHADYSTYISSYQQHIMQLCPYSTSRVNLPGLTESRSDTSMMKHDLQ